MNDLGYKRNLLGLFFGYRPSRYFLFLHSGESGYSDHAAIALAHCAQAIGAQDCFHYLIPGYVGHANINRHGGDRSVYDEVDAILLRDESQHIAYVNARAQVEAYQAADIAWVAESQL